MQYRFGAPRQAETTLSCPHCSQKLQIARTCHEVYMRCTVCGKVFPLKEFIARADEAMERFLEQAYVDRI